jgi:hypothetical protein
VFIEGGMCTCGPRELLALWSEKFDSEADFGIDVFGTGPAVGKSCDARRRCEDVLECDAIESESSREVPVEKREDNFFAPLVKGAAIVAAIRRLLLLREHLFCGSAAHLLGLNGKE